MNHNHQPSPRFPVETLGPRKTYHISELLPCLHPRFDTAAGLGQGPRGGRPPRFPAPAAQSPRRRAA